MQRFTTRAFRKAQRMTISAWDASRPTFRVKVGDGYVRIPAGPEIGWILSWRPDWKTMLVDRALAASPGVFIDVGANIGQTLLDYLNATRREGYIGFEPSARCVDHLEQVIKINHFSDCTVVASALSDSTEPLTYYTRGSADPGASLLPDVDPTKPVSTRVVPSYRFDDIAAGLLDSRAISLVKIDVEGAEGLVLAGMSETLAGQRPWLLTEVLNRDQHASEMSHRRRNEQLMSLIQQADYAVHRVLKSPDQLTLVGIEPVQEFPNIVYRPENAALCDYLFTPRERPFDPTTPVCD